jgi:hypothetical protein
VRRARAVYSELLLVFSPPPQQNTKTRQGGPLLWAAAVGQPRHTHANQGGVMLYAFLPLSFHTSVYSHCSFLTHRHIALSRSNLIESIINGDDNNNNNNTDNTKQL